MNLDTMHDTPYEARMRDLLAKYKLPRSRAKRLYVKRPESLTPLLRIFFKNQRIHPLAKEYHGCTEFDDSCTVIIHTYGTTRTFIWATRSKDQLFIQSEGAFIQVDVLDLKSKLTPVQQDFLQATLENDAMKYAEIVTTEERAFYKSIE
jgi:hypothetical protein